MSVGFGVKHIRFLKGLWEQAPAYDNFAAGTQPIDGMGKELGLRRLSDNYIIKRLFENARMQGFRNPAE